ncbi:MAG: beta-1,3-glucanase family protein [Candidatus Eremiobacteraeota bacterium]|nr:beta-1,3-glucanase family protein [Candidatus Eremiobacteraeota bacterium]
MRNQSHRMATLLLSAGLILLFTLAGCGGSTSGDSVNYWGGAETGFKVSGIMTSSATQAPLEGINCTLEATSGTTASRYTTVTDAQGAYSFSGVPAGDYRLTTSKEGYYTDNTYFTVAADTVLNWSTMKTDEWTAVMGADHPYDSTMAYVSSLVYPVGGSRNSAGSGTAAVISRGAGTSGVSVDIFQSGKGRGTGYTARGYISAAGQVDWSATVTSEAGEALFYKASPTDTYTMTASKAGQSFDTVSGITPAKGEFTNYVMYTRDSAGVKINIVNNSGYEDKSVFMTVTGHGYDAVTGQGCYFYYDNDAAAMKPFTSSVAESTYAIPLSSLTNAADETSGYTFNLPTTNTQSSRTYFSVSKAIKFVTSSDGSSLGHPNPSSSTDQNKTTLYDWIETSCDNGMFWPNTTCVDFYNMGLLAELYRTEPDPYGGNKDYWAAGFDSPRTDVIAALQAMPSAFTEGVMSEGSTVYRVLSPKELSSSPSNKAYSYMDDTIKSGWSYYAGSTNPLTIVYGGYTFEKQSSSTAANLVFKCSSPDKTYNIALPKSFEVFQCASGPLKNGTGDQAEDKLHAIVSAALNRGIFTSYSTWGTTTSYYTKNDGNNGYYNSYSDVLHKYAKDKKCYGFPYDDIYDQSSSLPGMEYSKVKKFRITLPKMK